jgi:hypothetical protein
MLLEFTNTESFRMEVYKEAITVWGGKDFPLTKQHGEYDFYVGAFNHFNKYWKHNLKQWLEAYTLPSNLRVLDKGDTYTESDIDFPTMWLESTDVWDDIKVGGPKAMNSFFEDLELWFKEQRGNK